MVRGAESTFAEKRSRVPPWLRSTLWFIAITLTLVMLWELYKVVGKHFDLTKPVRPDNVVMPHVWGMITELFEPARRGGAA